MRRLTKLQMLVAVTVVMAVAGLAASQQVAEARRNPRPAVAAVPSETATPVPTSIPTPAPTVVASGAGTTSAVARFSDDFESFAVGTSWADGAVNGRWTDVFNGYGSAQIASDGNNVLAQAPKASTSAGETHAALMVSSQQFIDVDVTLQMRTVSQLRTGSNPNPWEVAWVLWNYTDSTHFYYVILKPNGMEIGKEDPAYPGAQRFLVTSSTPYPAGRWYTVHIEQTGATFTVSVDGTVAGQFTDNERPYMAGAIGLYSEDALVHFNNIVVQ